MRAPELPCRLWTSASHQRTSVISSARRTTYQTWRAASWRAPKILSCGSNWPSDTSVRTRRKSANKRPVLGRTSACLRRGCWSLCLCRSAAECLEAALNTLSRALETNCDDPEVWSHYLSLFSRRGSKEEVQEMCEMAVEHAPNYRVWWNVRQLTCVPFFLRSSSDVVTWKRRGGVQE